MEERIVIVKYIKGTFARRTETINKKTPEKDPNNNAVKTLQCCTNKYGGIEYGLSSDDVDILMEEVLNIRKSDNYHYFKEKSKEWYINATIKIPAEGLKLDISYEMANVPYRVYSEEKKDWVTIDKVIKMPRNIKHWLVYHNLQKHPAVCKQGQIPLKHDFQIVDTESNKLAELAEHEILEKAIIAASNINSDADFRMYLLLMKTVVSELAHFNITSASSKDLKITFSKMVKNHPQVFINIHQDSAAKSKYYIERAVLHGLLTKENSIYYKGYVSLGNIDSTIKWLNDPINMVDSQEIKIKLQAIDADLVPDELTPKTKSTKK